MGSRIPQNLFRRVRGPEPETSAAPSLLFAFQTPNNRVPLDQKISRVSISRTDLRDAAEFGARTGRDRCNTFSRMCENEV